MSGTTREASIEWVARSLAEELGDAAGDAPARAEGLVAVCERYQVGVEHLIRWVRYRFPGKEWSELEWMRWCVSYTQACAELLKMQRDSPDWRKLCPRCYSHVAHNVMGVWMCPECGSLTE